MRCCTTGTHNNDRIGSNTSSSSCIVCSSQLVSKYFPSVSSNTWGSRTWTIFAESCFFIFFLVTPFEWMLWFDAMDRSTFVDTRGSSSDSKFMKAKERSNINFFHSFNWMHYGTILSTYLIADPCALYFLSSTSYGFRHEIDPVP